MSNTSVETYTVGQLVGLLGDHPDMNRRIEVPRFQRRLTWSTAQQRGLIESIHNDYPIGALLLYKMSSEGGAAEILQIVDGLQRTNTLQEYVRRPLLLAPSSILTDEELTSLLVGLSLEVELETARHRFETWMRHEESLDASSPLTLISAMSEEDRDALPNELFLAANTTIDIVKERTDIRSYQLPVIVYSGAAANLPEIFELVNTRGTQLNKYQIFAATWINSETQVNNEKIRQAVQEKYAELSDAGFRIEDYEHGAIRDHNLFEYLFGLGKLLASQFKYLFRGKDSPSETEPSAFAIATVCAGLPLGRMAELPDFMPRAADELIEPSAFETGIFEACKQVQAALKPWVSLRLNSQGDSVPVAHSELQMVSWIARFFCGRWEMGPAGVSEREGWQEDWEGLRTALPSWYLRDVITSHWRGPTYAILDERVWDRTTDDGPRPARIYTKPLTEARFRQDLNDWFSDQLDREQRARSHVRDSERLFLRFLYSGVVTVYEDQSETFEIEHLFPVKRLSQFAKDDDRGWPISCIANLALFTRRTNRESGAKTVKEYLEGLDEGDQVLLQEMMDRYLFASIDEVDIASEDDFTRQKYTQFLQQRWETILSKVVDDVPLLDDGHGA